jgi:hypothetical protein
MYKVARAELNVPSDVYTINESEARKILSSKNKNIEVLKVGHSWAVRFLNTKRK